MADSTEKPLVGVIMGSESDWAHVSPGCDLLKEFGIPYEARVISAHRTPELTSSMRPRPRNADCSASSPPPVAPLPFPA